MYGVLFIFIVINSNINEEYITTTKSQKTFLIYSYIKKICFFFPFFRLLVFEGNIINENFK